MAGSQVSSRPQHSPRPASGLAQQGFTLIELLAAAALLALIAVMAFGGLSGMSLARDRIEDSLDKTGDAQLAIWRIQNDLEQVRHRRIRDDFGDFQPSFTGDLDNGLLFTRGGRRNPLQLPRASLQRIQYQVNEGKLIRRSWTMLDRAQESTPREDVLLEGVSDLRWRYLNTEGAWQERWPDLRAVDDDDNPAPRAVELSFDSEAFGNITLLFRVMSSAT